MTPEEAELCLGSLEPIGWKLGLERMRSLTSVLGMPQNRFASIHVVGTNGKSSVTRMIAALLEAHGVSAGVYLSPHIEHWSERVRLRGAEIAPEAFAASVDRAAQAAAAVNRSLEGGEAVTQFEVATAAAFVALAAAEIEVGVIEAGLGGRLDATNVIPSRVCVLTSVALDHTQWLGETEAEIAAEKLAVLRDRTPLVVGDVSEEVLGLAQASAVEHGATIVRPDAADGIPIAGYQRDNFALATAAARAFLGDIDEEKVRLVAADVGIPGRAEVRDWDPPVIFDAAHNAEGAEALARSLPELSGDRPVIGCVAILEDKDADAMLAALAPACELIVCTQVAEDTLGAIGRPGARFRSADELEEIATAVGGAPAEAVVDPVAAFARARELARERRGVALVAGSHYLLRDLWTAKRAPNSSR